MECDKDSPIRAVKHSSLFFFLHVHTRQQFWNLNDNGFIPLKEKISQVPIHSRKLEYFYYAFLINSYIHTFFAMRISKFSQDITSNKPVYLTDSKPRLHIKHRENYKRNDFCNNNDASVLDIAFVKLCPGPQWSSLLLFMTCPQPQGSV